MSAAPQRQPREVIDFPPNVPVTVSLRYGQPKMISNQYGERAMFTTVDNRLLFLDVGIAGKIVDLGINVREPFTIMRRESGHAGEPLTWEVARIAPSSGQQPDGTYVVPKDTTVAPNNAAAPAPKPPAMASQRISSMTLAQEAKAAVDAYAEVLEHGLKSHAGKVKPDEIQRIFTTVYIQRKGAA